MNIFNWLFDAIAGVLLIGFLVQGFRKGFSRLIIPILVNLVLVAVVFFSSGVISGYFYENMIEDSVQLQLEETVKKFDLETSFNRHYEELTLIGEVTDKEMEGVLGSEKQMDEKFWKLIDRTSGVGDKVDTGVCYTALRKIITDDLQADISEKLPPCAGKYFDQLDETDREETFIILNRLYKDRSDAASYIANTCIHDELFVFVKICSFVVFSAVVLIITGIIFAIVYKNREVDPNGIGDSLAGVLIEIVNGLVFLTIFAMLVKIVVYSGIQVENIMDEQTLNSSYVFKFLYSINKFMPGARI